MTINYSDTNPKSRFDIKLEACNVKICEAMCCYDGVYIMEAEEKFLMELAAEVPQFNFLPTPFIVDGYWRGKLHGRKTVTKPHKYSNPAYPEHFTKTRCIFADDIGFCELEKFARSRGQHPWSYKPATCWLFPLDVEQGNVVPPPMDIFLDPNRHEGYPGYVTSVPCGRNEPHGKPWTETLKHEIAYFNAVNRLPILGSPGHTVSELLKKKETKL